MQIEFADKKLELMASDLNYTGGYSPAVVKGFRKVVQAILAATDEREFYHRPAFHFEKLERSKTEHSFRANDQYRVIVEILGDAQSKVVRILKIEDYHK